MQHSHDCWLAEDPEVDSLYTVLKYIDIVALNVPSDSMCSSYVLLFIPLKHLNVSRYYTLLCRAVY